MGKHTQLSLEQKLHVIDGIRARRAELEQERPTFVLLARQFANEVGAAISPATLAGLAKAAGVVWEPKGKAHGAFKKSAYADLQRRFGHLEEALGEERRNNLGFARRIDAEVAYLRGLVHHLYTELAASPPPGVVLPTPERVSVAGNNGAPGRKS